MDQQDRGPEEERAAARAVAERLVAECAPMLEAHKAELQSRRVEVKLKMETDGFSFTLPVRDGHARFLLIGHPNGRSYSVSEITAGSLRRPWEKRDKLIVDASVTVADLQARLQDFIRRHTERRS